MRYMKYLPLVAVLMLPLTYSQAQVEDSQAQVEDSQAQVENEIGVPPVCAYATDITLTLARLTAITRLAGLWAACLSALAPGMVGVEVGGVAAGAPGATDMRATADAVTPVGEVTPVSEALTVVAASHAVQVADSTVAAVADPTVQVAEDSTEVVGTVEAVDMVAVDTGNRGVMRSPIR